jgi:hypothetical protein
MENKKRKSKAIIISVLALLVLIFSLFLIYKNRDSFGVKTSATIAKIFSPLDTSENRKRETIQAGEDLFKGDPVTDGGFSGETRIVRKALGEDAILGYVNHNILSGKTGEITLSGSGISVVGSFWNSISGFLNKTFDFNFKSACSDGKDNDEDGLIDENDFNCHLDGDINKEYKPDHFSESENPLDSDFGIQGVDLVAGVVFPTSSPVNLEVDLNSEIINRGNEGVSQSFIVLFTISDSKDDGSNNTYITTTLPTLNAKDSNTASVKHTFNQTGIYYIRACADRKDISDDGLIPEAFEDNNCGVWTTFTVTNTLPNTGTRPQCSDEEDNDGDNLVDINDPACHAGGVISGEYLAEYDSESIISYECNDTIDNDEDGLIDENDPVCHEDGDINGEYLPKYDSESSISYECNDTIDNDEDNFIDDLDPNCHTGGLLSNEYKPNHDSESESPASKNVCLDIEQNPITFTDEEQAELDELLRKFYLIAPTLKSEPDVSLVYSEIENQQNFSNQLDAYISMCYAETSNPTYTGPKEKYGNPWFNYYNRGSYVKELGNGGSSSYCKNDSTKPNPHNFDRKRCPMFKTQSDCERYWGHNVWGTSLYLATGCTWVETLNLEEYETLLNIW